PQSGSVVVGGTFSFTATVYLENGNPVSGKTVTWTSNQPQVASVSSTGVVTGVAAGGPVTITATCEGKSGSASITVTQPPVNSVDVSPGAPSIQVNSTVQLTATMKDASGQVLTGRPVTWSSSNPSIASVSTAGLVTGVMAGGPVTITAMSEGKSGTAAVTVTP